MTTPAAKSSRPDLESLALTLEQSNDYRVLRRFVTPDYYDDPATKPKDAKLAAVVDVETTGLGSDASVIELAIGTFEFSSDGGIYGLKDSFQGYQDPGEPLDPFVSQLTGITDDDVKGQALDLDAIDNLMQPVDLVIAHNASFDRPHVERLYADFANKPWGCSLKEVPWREVGLESAKLEFLAYRFGVFFGGHRALTDCWATLHVLAQTLPDTGERAFAKLLDSVRQTQYRVWAVNAPFAAKDTLKARGYRWNPGTDGRPKAWYTEVHDAEAEQAYLHSEIYGKSQNLVIDKLTAFNRYQ